VDNPRLTVRQAKGKNPLKVVIDGNLSIPMNSAVLQSGDANGTLIFTCKGNDSKKVLNLESRGIEVIECDSEYPNKIDLLTVLKILGKRKIISLFVEGGQSIFSQFIQENIFDEIIILQAPVIIGRGISAFQKEYKNNLDLRKIGNLGIDTKIVLRRLKK